MFAQKKRLTSAATSARAVAPTFPLLATRPAHQSRPAKRSHWLPRLPSRIERPEYQVCTSTVVCCLSFIPSRSVVPFVRTARTPADVLPQCRARHSFTHAHERCRSVILLASSVCVRRPVTSCIPIAVSRSLVSFSLLTYRVPTVYRRTAIDSCRSSGPREQSARK